MIDLVTEIVTKTQVIEFLEPPTRQVLTETNSTLETNVVEVETSIYTVQIG